MPSLPQRPPTPSDAVTEPPADLAGRVALVTGGSRGIGAATARRLAGLGALVVLTYHRDQRSAREVAEQITLVGGRAEIASLDITEPDQVRRRVDDVLDQHGRVDVLVANASAGFRRAELAELSVEELVGPVADNLRATHLLTTLLAGQMRERGWGRLVYVSSRHAHGPSAPGMAVNGTAKAALVGYLRYVVDELTGGGVTANIVSPGMVDTDASRAIGLPAPVVGLLVAATPSGRIAAPADVAAAITMLVTAGDLLNGVELPVSGGLNHPLPMSRLLPALAQVSA